MMSMERWGTAQPQKTRAAIACVRHVPPVRAAVAASAQRSVSVSIRRHVHVVANYVAAETTRDTLATFRETRATIWNAALRHSSTQVWRGNARRRARCVMTLNVGIALDSRGPKDLTGGRVAQ